VQPGNPKAMLAQLHRFVSDTRPPGSRCTIDAHQINLAAVRLRRYGVLKIRGLLDPGAISAVGAAARDLYGERDARVAAGECLTAPERQSHLRRTLALDRIMAGGTPAADLLDCPAIRALAGLHLGKPPRLDPNSYVRALIPGPHIQALPFHQDQYILQTPLLNVWIPLTECGVHAPSLEVVVTDRRDLIAVAGLPDHAVPVERARIDERLVLEMFGPGALWRPNLSLGDMLVFAGTTIHRSHVTPQMTKPRLSVELRLVSSAPH
jgi:hypothetical protein